jgi:HEAT repeat protein
MPSSLLQKVLLVAVGLLLWAPAAAVADAGLADRMLSLHESGASYVLQRDALSADQFLADEELLDLRSHADWRVRHQSQVILGWRHHRVLFAEIAAAAPAHDRAGRPIFNQRSFRDPAARPAVLERLLHGTEPASIRAGLAGSLIGMRSDWDVLNEELLRIEPMAEVRAILVWSMRRAGAKAAAGGITLGMADADPRVRAETCRTVGWRNDGAGHAASLLAALGDADPVVRAMAARSLGWRHVAAAWEPLLLLLDDASAEVRLHSLRALSRIDPGAVAQLAPLSGLLRDPDPRVARVAKRLSR